MNILKKYHKYIFSLASFLILVVGLGATTYLVTQRQDIRNRAAGPDLGQQHYVIGGGDPGEKLNILFIPVGFPDTATVRGVINYIFINGNVNPDGYTFAGVLNTAPFSKYKDRINVSYVDKNLDESYFACNRLTGSLTCNDKVVSSVYSQSFKADYITLIISSSSGQVDSTMGGTPVIYYSHYNIPGEPTNGSAWLHEFGHNFGGLEDEYLYWNFDGSAPYNKCSRSTDPACFDEFAKGKALSPNIDGGIGCKKWCQSFDTNKLLSLNAECGKQTTKENCLATKPALPEPKPCSWFEQKVPVYNTQCVVSWTSSGVSHGINYDNNIGVNCQNNTQCNIGSAMGALTYRSDPDIMGGGGGEIDGGNNFNSISNSFMDNIFQCCYPRVDSPVCDTFRSQAKNMVENGIGRFAESALLKIAYCGKTIPDVALCNQSCIGGQLCTSGVVCDASSGTCRNPSCPKRDDCMCDNGKCDSTCTVSKDDCDAGLKCIQQTDSPPDVGFCRNPSCSTETTCSCGPVLKVDQVSIETGSKVTVSWSNISSPTTTDWVALYQPGVADGTYKDWMYVSSCTKIAGQPKTVGSCEMTIPQNTPAGNYEFRLFAKNGWTKLTTSNTFAVLAPPPPTLTASPDIVTTPGIVNMTWDKITNPAAGDWAGIYYPGDVNTAYKDWFYVSSCTKTAGQPKGAGSCAISIPSNLTPAPNYEFRLFANNSYTKLATSNTFMVKEGETIPVTISISPANSVSGESVTLNFNNIPSPKTFDWAGIYATNNSNSYVDWVYLRSTGVCNKSAGDAKPSGSCQYTIPANLSSGTYELRLFTNNSYTKLATSNTITVTQQSNTPTLSAVYAKGVLTVDYKDIVSPTPADWMGIYSPGETDTKKYKDWVYVRDTGACTKTAGDGKASGSCQYALPTNLPAGNYELRLFANNGFTKLATSNIFELFNK